MKKILVAGFIGLIAFTSCENSGSSTIGTYEKEETHSTEKRETGSGHGHEKQGTDHDKEDTTKAGTSAH